mmetsp:Transcript_13308/g.22602  ORF Transcript_13308/g.22602 Transcript_13308/m.22602 type:complete len:187 (-) Transcript_13308:41-601(-)
MYPKEPKVLATKQGAWLRAMCGVFCLLHNVFFVVALAITGFSPMIVSLLLAVWSYSAYLTVREWTVLLYVFFLGLSSFLMVADNFEDKTTRYNENTLMPIGFFLQVGMQVTGVYYIGKAYFYFRKTGGIHGFRGTADLPEERLLAKSNELFKKGAEKVESAIDKDNEREKKDDLEGVTVQKAINGE